mmetsp:Transcript_25439/g.35820  ORF Transcript_25439/g.35820 Transcript_25439/m.35820 type:complete len:102 (+) Transcript_25439:117-422(+)
MRSLSIIATAAFCLAKSDAFVPQDIQQQATALHAIEDRRAFLGTAAAAFVAGGIMTPPVVVFAEDAVDDLAMPSEEEQKAAEKAAMEERLRKKAELQKKSY